MKTSSGEYLVLDKKAENKRKRRHRDGARPRVKNAQLSHGYDAHTHVHPRDMLLNTLNVCIPVCSHWSDLLDGHGGVVADAVDGGAHHPVRSLPNHLKVVVARWDLHFFWSSTRRSINYFHTQSE